MPSTQQTVLSKTSLPLHSLFTSELGNASLLACPALRERGTSWRPDGQSWRQWCELELRDFWAPQLRELYNLAISGKLWPFLSQAEMAAARLGADERLESLRAGEELLAHSEGARGKEVLLKLYREQQAQGLEAWFHAVLAARAAFFSLPQSALILAFAWREWRAQQRLRVVLEAEELWAEFGRSDAGELLSVMPECLSGAWRVVGQKGHLRQQLEG